MYKFSKGDILVDNGNGVFNISKEDEQLFGVNLKYLCNELKAIRYDRTQWGVDHFIALQDYNSSKITKKDLNPNIHLSEGNIKSKGTEDVMFLTWSLPSKITCPYSTEMCRKKCFAQKNETFKGVRESRQKNLEETKKDTFVQDMINHLEYHLSRKKALDKRIFVRIHTSGDFYSYEYFKKWVDIAQHFIGNDKILFQAYTKSMPIIEKYLYWDEDENDWGYWRDYETSDESAQALRDTNIHLVWSIWHDTPKEYTDMAETLEMQTFTALPKLEIPMAVNNGSFLCNGDCGNCKECYTGTSNTVVIPYH